MTKVLHIDAGNMFGGVETLLVTLARNRELCPDFDPEFAVCCEGRLSAELVKSGVRVHSLGEVRARNPLSIVRARRKLRELLARSPVDVVVCHMPWVQAMFGPVARQLRIPLVCWLHGASRGKHWVERWAKSIRPDLVLCNSNFSAASVSEIYPGMAATVLHYPVEDVGWRTDSGIRNALRSELGTSGDSTVIIQVSRLEEWKGQMLHLEALAALRGIPKWSCWIVGGPQRPAEAAFLAKLKSRAEELGLSSRVHFLGQRSDIADLLTAADIFCQPNIQPEPFGIVFVEAMFAGLPIVTTAIGGPLEIVDERCGILVPASDVTELAGALRSLIENSQLRGKLGNGGRIRAEELCGVKAQMSKFFKLLTPLLHANSNCGTAVS